MNDQVLPPSPSQRVGDPTGSGTGYPWQTGDPLYAADLNYAIENSSFLVHDSLLTTGGTMTGPLTLAGNATAPLQAVPLQQMHVVSVLDYGAKGDGATDDTAAIRTVLTNNAGKAIVLIPNTGHPYIVSGSLSLPSNTDLIIDGTLLLKTGSTVGGAGIVDIANQSNIIIRGYGTIDGNDPSSTSSTHCAGISARTVTNLRVSGITLQNAHYWNLNVTGSQNVVIDGVHMNGGGNANEFAAGSDNCWLMNCTIENILPDFGFSFYGGVTNSGAIGNTIRNCNVGIFVLSDSGQPAVCKNILIEGNIIYNSYVSAIAADTAIAGLHEAVIINGNRLYDNNTSNQTAQAHIMLGGVQNCVVSGNMISGLDPVNSCAYGVRLKNPTAATVTGNLIFNMGQSSEPGFGVWVDTAGFALVDGNVFHDYRSTRYMSAIGGTAGASNVFTNNLFGQLVAGAPITATLRSDTVVSNAGAVSNPGATGSWKLGNVLGLSGTFGTAAPYVWAQQGGYIGWNYTASLGETDFINSRGTGGGGFNFYNVASNSSATPALLASMNSAGIQYGGVGGSNYVGFTWGSGNLTATIDGSPTLMGALAPLNYTATGAITSRSVQDRAADVVNVLDFGAKGDGTTDDYAAICAARDSKPSGSEVNLWFPGYRTYYQSQVVQQNSRKLFFDVAPTSTLTGAGGGFGPYYWANAASAWQNQSRWEAYTGAPQWFQTVGPVYQITNNGTGTGSSNVGIGMRTSYTTNAVGANAQFDVLRNDIMTVATPSVANGSQWFNGWTVIMSPQDNTNGWGVCVAEWNAVNRGPDAGWANARGALAHWTGGLQIAGEATDFSGAGGTGRNITYSFATTASGSVNSLGFRVQTYNALLIEANAIGPNGRGIYAGGYLAAPNIPTSPLPYAPFQADNAWQNGIVMSGATFTGNAITSPGFTVDGSGNVTAPNLTALGQVTAAGVGAVMRVTNNTGSWITFGANAYAPPTAATRSAGTKLVLYENTPVDLDDAIGVDAGVVWYTCGINSVHRFQCGTNVIGTFSTANGLVATTLTTGGAGGPTWTAGTAAPSSTQPVGSLYSRTGGAVGATLYVSRGGGTWAAVAGV